MKIIHTSDWHIGQTLYQFSREDEHKYFFKVLGRKKENVGENITEQECEKMNAFYHVGFSSKGIWWEERPRPKGRGRSLSF